MSAWTRRQLISDEKFRTAMPDLLNFTLAAEIVTQHCCQQCSTADAVVRCLDCVSSGSMFFCSACDTVIHRKNVFHNREVMIEGFYKAIPPTSMVLVDDSGQYQLSQQGVLQQAVPLLCFYNVDYIHYATKQATSVY